MPTAEHFANLREAYLKREFPEEHARMKAAGTLTAHLEEIGQSAIEMWDETTGQMRNDPQMPQEQPARMQAFEAIPETVRDLINHDMIWVPPASQGQIQAV